MWRDAPERPRFDPFDHWSLLAADLHELFGIDTGDPVVWERSWPWLRSRVDAVMSTPPNRILVPTEGGYEIRLVWRTRTQHACYEGVTR
ncbi:hypothetical protein GCM10009785_01620 [Brooklawnia cerclae]|uniref:Uncharacterized protein n=1 Tax=Brooklawnia cerclae TaxID=349934 RepID=A0ABX0SD25_9ACTN|nr:hypothetical protein [Brooklawnia cerclae]NIH56244.1 hypothetical protein [Brooklawnia cerclae]